MKNYSAKNEIIIVNMLSPHNTDYFFYNITYQYVAEDHKINKPLKEKL